jgi:hypothetical protein
LATVIALQVCTALPRLAAVPPTQTVRAIIPDFPNNRYWLGEYLPALLQKVIRDDKRERGTLVELGISTDPMPPDHVLALSGGGDAGVFAAGLLSGWSITQDSAAVQACNRRQRTSIDRSVRLRRTHQR